MNSGDPKDHFCLKSLPNGVACMKKGYHYVTTNSNLGMLSTIFCKKHYEDSKLNLTLRRICLEQTTTQGERQS